MAAPAGADSILFDYFHHEFCTGGWREEETFMAATATWPAGIVPVVHFSSSKKKWEDPAALPAAHADYIYSPVSTYHHEVDIMFEAKAREPAVFKYLNNYKIAAV